MKNKFTWISAVFTLLTVALIFTGCPDKGPSGANAVKPVIGTQPQNTTYQIPRDSIVTPLTVSATVTDGGTLSYQWYYATSLTGAGTGVGNDEESYTPDQFELTEGAAGSYFYYVVVTNTNSKAAGKKSASATSSRATVTVSQITGDWDAAEPVITIQPQGATYKAGTDDAIAALTVDATKSDAGTLSYRWYSNGTASNEDGTEITGSAGGGKSFTPPINLSQLNTATAFYYYVVVTNRNNSATGEKTKTATSNVVTITIEAADSWDARPPTISVQPKGASYRVGATPAPLTVTAAEPANEAGASLSYQWYSAANTSDAGTAVTDGAGGTTDSYTPAPSSTLGTVYYYVKVTNTNNSAPGTKTASIDSSRAAITVLPPFNPNITITGSGTNFTAADGNSSTIGTGAIQAVIDTIRGLANGESVNIQFGDGTTALDIGTGSAGFSGDWGAGVITLKGKITSTATGSSGTVTIGDAVSVTIVGSIANTDATSGTANAAGKAVYISATGGRVEVADGAEITANTGNALCNAGSGTVIISGGALTSANQSASSGTAGYSAGTVSCVGANANLTISGGTVKNTATSNGFGVWMNSNGATPPTMLTLSGGTIDVAVDVTSSRAVAIIWSTSITLEGAGPTITGGKRIYISNGTPNPWTDGKIIAESTFAPAGKTYLLGFNSSTPPDNGRVIVEGGAPFVDTFYKNSAGTKFTVTGNDLTF